MKLASSFFTCALSLACALPSYSSDDDMGDFQLSRSAWEAAMDPLEPGHKAILKPCVLDFDLDQIAALKDLLKGATSKEASDIIYWASGYPASFLQSMAGAEFASRQRSILLFHGKELSSEQLPPLKRLLKDADEQQSRDIIFWAHSQNAQTLESIANVGFEPRHRKYVLYAAAPMELDLYTLLKDVLKDTSDENTDDLIGAFMNASVEYIKTAAGMWPAERLEYLNYHNAFQALLRTHMGSSDEEQ